MLAFGSLRTGQSSKWACNHCRHRMHSSGHSSSCSSRLLSGQSLTWACLQCSHQISSSSCISSSSRISSSYRSSGISSKDTLVPPCLSCQSRLRMQAVVSTWLQSRYIAWALCYTCRLNALHEWVHAQYRPLLKQQKLVPATVGLSQLPITQSKEQTVDHDLLSHVVSPPSQTRCRTPQWLSPYDFFIPVIKWQWCWPLWVLSMSMFKSAISRAPSDQWHACCM